MFRRVYHPYRAEVEGTVESLSKITLDDVKAFHTAMYTQSRINFGIAGGYPKEFIDRVKRDLTTLPVRTSRKWFFPLRGLRSE